MSQPTLKSSTALPGTKSSLKGKANATAPVALKSEPVPAGTEGLVETLADLRTEVVLSVLKASIRSQKKGKNMAARTLTAEAAMKKVKALSKDIAERLQENDEKALKDVTDLRAHVKLEELQTFDDMLDDWVSLKS